MKPHHNDYRLSRRPCCLGKTCNDGVAMIQASYMKVGSRWKHQVLFLIDEAHPDNVLLRPEFSRFSREVFQNPLSAAN